MGRQRSSLLQRFLSILVLLPVALCMIWLGGWWFFALVALVMTAAAWEYVRMLGQLGYRPPYPFAMGMLWTILLAFQLADTRYLQPIFAALLILSLSWHVLLDKSRTPMENWLLPLAGTLYIGWTAGHLLSLRALPGGAYRLLLTLGIIWLADSGAYFVGKAWGKHPMAPRVSPQKTWEGHLGGIAVGVTGGALLSGLGGLGWGHGLLLGFLISAVAPVGDLGVSMIKRQAGVKDTGRLIPGHGGALDRSDSLLVAVVVGFYYQVWAMGALGGV